MFRGHTASVSCFVEFSNGKIVICFCEVKDEDQSRSPLAFFCVVGTRLVFVRKKCQVVLRKPAKVLLEIDN